MGTSGAYGGSGARAWIEVRDAWGDLDAESLPDSAPPTAPGDDSGEDRPDPALDRLGTAIADALWRGDRETRLPRPPLIPLSSLLPRTRGSSAGGGGGAGGAATGRTGTSRRSGGRFGRQVLRQAASGGAAIGAATAYRDRDAEALGAYGLTLAELDALTPRNRCARLLDLVLGDAGHPDEAVVRKAAAQQVKRILTEGAPPSPVQAVRDFVGEMTMQLGLVELRDQILRGAATTSQVVQKERGLRQWITAKLRSLDLGGYGRVTATDCHQAAARFAHDALRLLRTR